MFRFLGVLAAALLLTLVPVGIGIWVIADAPAQQQPEYRSTPLASYDTTTVAIARAGFCDRVAPEAVHEALTAEPTDESTWSNGDEVPGSGEIGHEFGCSYVAAGVEASGWVLTPPVTVAKAEALATATGQERGCRVPSDAEPYGDPSVTTLCTRGQRVVASVHGLFGDAWLSCRLSVAKGTSGEELLDRTGRWCVAVARAAAA